MVHVHTLRLLEAWRARRLPGASLPERTALSPLLFGPLLPQMFVLAEVGGAWRYRTAGALVEDLHGRTLAGASFHAVWAEDDQSAVARRLATARDGGRCWVAACRGETAHGRTVRLELTLAPVTGPLGAPDRWIGLCQPLSALVRLQGEPMQRLRLEATSGGGPRLVVDNTASEAAA